MFWKYNRSSESVLVLITFNENKVLCNGYELQWQKVHLRIDKINFLFLLRKNLSKMLKIVLCSREEKLPKIDSKYKRKNSYSSIFKL